MNQNVTNVFLSTFVLKFNLLESRESHKAVRSHHKTQFMQHIE